MESFDIQFKTALREQYNAKTVLLKNVPYITTITVCFYLSSAPRNIDNIVALVKQPEEHEALTSLINEVFGGQSMFFPKSDTVTFHNCRVFVFMDNRGGHTNDDCKKIAIKCFTNGTLHITGVDRLQRAQEIAEMFCVLIELVDGGTGIDGMYTIRNHNIQLINIHSSLKLQENNSIDLLELSMLLRRHTTVVSSYNNERHSGVIIKYLTSNMNNVSILVFESGNILVCGVKDKVDFVESFDFIIDFVQNHQNEIYIADTNSILKNRLVRKRQKTERKFDYGQYLLFK